jgi:hypothetical protein
MTRNAVKCESTHEALAQTTSMCHTVAEPYSGKYLFCCSQEAIRVWSYETAIEVGSLFSLVVLHCVNHDLTMCNGASVMTAW